jgi:hypothetical protein
VGAARVSVGIRAALSVLAVAFTGYLAVGALLWTTPPANPMVQLVAVVLDHLHQTRVLVVVVVVL